MRKTIQIILKNKKTELITVTEELLKSWLGNPTFKKSTLNPTNKRIGLATGLAWTEVGGEILEIEVTAVSGKGNLTLTGQLGEVMQESAQAALSYIRTRASVLGLAASFHTNKDIHIHMPEGATPKDGPSAGISICSALVSALTKNPTLDKLAMTGEITLQGRVLSVGGLKEKLLAAQQYGISKVIVSQENKDDIKEISEEISLDKLNIVFVSHMDEVLQQVFEVSPFEKKKQKIRKKKITPVRP